MQYFQRFEKEARESLSKNQPILVARSATGETRYCTPITISNKPPGSIKQRNEFHVRPAIFQSQHRHVGRRSSNKLQDFKER